MISTLIADPEPRRHPTSKIRVSRPPRLDPPYDDERSPDARPEMPVPVADRAEPAPAPSPAPPARSPSSGRAATAYIRLCVEVLNGYRPPSHLRRIGGPVEFNEVIDQIRRRHFQRGHFTSQFPGAADHPGRGNAAGAGYPATNRSGLDGEPGSLTNRSATGLVAGTDPRRRNQRSGAYSLTRVRISEPLDGIAEVVAVLSRDGSSIAVALRLELRGGTWTCVIMQVI